MARIKIFVIDDHAIMRDGIRMIFDQDGQVEIVGEAGDIETALDAIRILNPNPNLVLLDIHLDHENSIDRIREITAACHDCKILLLTGIVDEDTSRRALLSGADGLVLKTEASDMLKSAILKVHAGESWFDRSITSRLLSETLRQQEASAEIKALIEQLTPREIQVITLIGKGKANKEIAQSLKISEKTVRNHLTLIYSKLQVTNRLELVLFASKHKLVTLHEPPEFPDT